MTTSPEQEQGSSLTAPKEPTNTRSQRTTISCFSCRHKKLKCDRGRPCGNCVKRGISCAYATPTERPQTQNRGGNTQLYSRIRHLEDLLATLVTDRRTAPDAASTQPAVSTNGSSSSKASPEDGRFHNEAVKNNTPASDRDGQDEPLGGFGHMRMNDSEITYVSATHWAAIRDNITSIREYIEAGDGQYDSTQALFEGPSLLLGICTPSTLDEIMTSMPPRATVDRLVSRYFNSGEPSVLIFHMPTFQQEYDRFWNDPHGTPITWISLLFSVMCLGVFFHLRSGEDPPDMPCSSKQATDLFRLRAVECLVLGNYTKPKAYTIEALLLHTQCEYFSSETAQSGVWVLWGMLTRLALYIGLHRDSKHYPEISCFDGEMRRRKWALITQLDLLISYQAGLPRMVREGEGDTELPHNLYDEDFDKSSTELPPSRSDREITPVSYSICKGKLSHVFGLIADQASSIKPPTMESLVELDRQLSEAYSCIPPHLQLRSLNRSVTDSPSLIMRRYTTDILYHKACCLLHRRYFDMSPASNSQYQISRTRCLDSAIQLLKHQATINQEIQPGGLLYRDKWFASSLTSHDFLLAAMIICLELQQDDKRRAGGQEFPTSDHERNGNFEMERTYRREELLQALQISHDLWSLSAPHSKDAAHASEALAVMLGKIKNSPVAIQLPNRGTDIHRPSTAVTVPPFMFGVAANSSEGEHNEVRDGTMVIPEENPRAFDFGTSNTGEDWISVDQDRLFPSSAFDSNTSCGMVPSDVGISHHAGGFDMDVSADINWRLWDSQVQNMGMHEPWMGDGQGF